MQDDLKFASEAITQIAMQAMKSIENLYAGRNFDNSAPSSSSKVPNLSPSVGTPSSSNEPDDSEYFDDPRFPIIEEPKVEKPKVQEPTKTEISKPKVQKIDRPPKYDSDLENLLL